MKIVSWNINGIRASKTDLKALFESLHGDVICLQETKVTRDMLDEASAILEGFNSYFSFSKKRSGYSGTANFCRNSFIPDNAEEGLSGNVSPDRKGNVGCYGNLTSFSEDELKGLDAEGRTVITQHTVRLPSGEEKSLAIINVYCPRFDPDREDRFQYKMRFHALLQTRAEAILKSGSHVIVLGDLNCTHKALDRSKGDADGESNKRPGRLWLNQMIWEEGRDPSLDVELDCEDFMAITPYTVGGKFVDTFRHLHPDKEGAFSNWCTLTNARSTNYGRRLDYILADVGLVKSCLVSADILQQVEGSDHCPVTVELNCMPVSAKSCPPLCTKYMPEFQGKQQKLSNFFSKLTKKDLEEKDKLGCVNVNRGDSDTKESGLNSVKRSLGMELPSSQPLKKQKTADLKKSSSGVKQGSLMQFFKGKNSKQTLNERESSSVLSSPESAKKSFFGLSVGIEGSVDKEDTGEKSKYFNSGNDTSNSSRVCDKEGTDKKTVQTNVLKENSQTTASAWKNLLGGLGPAPLCKGHNEPCVLRMVKKAGPNKGRQFYTCARGEGLKSNPEARCDFFKWVDKKKS